MLITNSQGFIKNCLFVDNKGQIFGGGGAIRNYKSSPDIINCTFSNNSAGYGGAIDNSPECSPKIINTIFWNNTGSIVGNEMHNASNSHPIFSNCDIKGGWNGPNISNEGGSTVINSGGNINADPFFIASHNGYYNLSQISAGQDVDSPCVDAGNEMAINLGLDIFSTRTDEIADDGIVDIGFHYFAIAPDIAPDIKANGSGNAITLMTSDTLSVSINLVAGSKLSEDADWWVVVKTPFDPPNDWHYYDVSSGTWLPGFVVTYQGSLLDLATLEVLNMNGLPEGTYIFYFAVDMVMNGSIYFDPLYFDSVVVSLTP